MSSTSKNARVETLVFADGSTYHGQIFGEEKQGKPHGYGTQLVPTEANGVKEQLRVTGYFVNGKNCGPGVFHSPQGTFFGHWNKEHKRDGKGLFVTKQGKQIVHRYDNGKLLKKLKRRPPSEALLHWRGPHFCATSGTPPSPRWGHTATIVGPMMVVFGGQGIDDDGRTVVYNDVHILDLNAMEWLQPPVAGDIPPPLSGHTATAVGDSLYIIGGQRGIEVSSAVYVFDCQLGQWSCVVKKGINLSGHSACLVGGDIWTIVQGTVFKLDLQSHTWSQVEVDNSTMLQMRVPTNVSSHSAVVWGDYIVCFGGRIHGGVLGQGKGGKNYQRCSEDVSMLNTKTLRWEVPACDEPPPVAKSDLFDYVGIPTPSHTLPRCEHTAAIVEDRYMYIYGGYTTCSPRLNIVDSSYLSDVHVLDLQEMKWISPQLSFYFSYPRSGHSMAFNGVDFFCLGGKNHAFPSLVELSVLHTGKFSAAKKKKKPKPAAAANDDAASAQPADAPPTSSAT